MAKHEVQITVWIDPTQYASGTELDESSYLGNFPVHEDTDEAAVKIAQECLLGHADWPMEQPGISFVCGNADGHLTIEEIKDDMIISLDDALQEAVENINA